MKKSICAACFAFPFANVNGAAADECDTGPLATPIQVPFAHTVGQDDAGEITIGAWIRTTLQALNPIDYACNSLGANSRMPAGCTMVLKFNDGWRGTGQILGGFCLTPNITIFNFQGDGGNARHKTPILLDLDRNQFHLSGGPVNFDIDADGETEAIAWTSAGELDGFLYLDRNGNGVVDDGSELFGNATLLASGEVAQNGYQALVEFDLLERGGVEDGVMNALDLVFANLRVWVDINADGICELHETLSMAEAGVLAIELEYIESPRTDQYGNEFRYIARGWSDVNGGAKQLWTTDVFFNFVEE